MGFLHRQRDVVNAGANSTRNTFRRDLRRGACERWSSHPEQRSLSRAAHRQRGNRQRKNTRSFPLCSCTPEDTCHTPHTRSRLRVKLRKLELILEIHSVPFFFFSGLKRYLHSCAFLSLWTCSPVCMNKLSHRPVGWCSCAHRCCRCTCDCCLGLTGENHKTNDKT